VPVSESALRAIGLRSMVIDVYIWPAYRLHALKKHLGAGFGTVWRFWQHFPECLALPVAAEARVDIGNCGAILPQSRPAIAKV
jgi:hypothetical protein